MMNIKASKQVLILTAAFSTVLAQGVWAAGPTLGTECATAFSETSSPEIAWRKSATHAETVEAATSQKRENEIEKRSKLMENEVLGIGMPGDTPPLEFFSAEGVNERYIHHTDGNSHVPTRIVLSNVGPSGKVKGTVLLPVSGHTGAANAKAWAKTDTYTLHVETSKDQQGKSWGSYDGANAPVIAQDAKSLDLVTSHEVELQLSKDHVVRITYFRSGSGGPGGYFDGRVLELVWDGT
jgi:hypothetical protein